MDQKELDDAYDQFVYAPNARQVIARCHRNSELVRERLGAPKRMAYGPTPIEALDIYSAKTENAPINIFVHGGAWRAEVAAGSASPRCWSMLVFISSCSTSTMSSTLAAI
jgi:arylformamidase